MLLNVALLAILGLLAYQIRQKVLLARKREVAMLLMRTPNADVPRPAALGKVAALDATSYQDAVAKNLFSKDRNPIPIPDPPPPPPPPQLPPSFPVARGVMIWDGLPPTIVLSDSKGSGTQRGYHPGEKIGEWKILSVDNQYVVLEWNGKQFKKRLDELMDRTPIQVAEAPQVQQATAAPPATKSLSESKNGQGADMGGGVKACVAGDTQPTGAVVSGLKKVVSQTPFGSVCRWEPTN